MTDKTVCFSGHRRIPIDQQAVLRQRLLTTITRLIGRGYSCFAAGGALGFDTMAEQAVVQLKEEYPHIRLVLMLPHRAQARSWSEQDRAVYERMKARADRVIYTSDEYVRGCMQKRNRQLVEGSSLCVCYLTQATGGTAYTVKYARKMGMEVINLA